MDATLIPAQPGARPDGHGHGDAHVATATMRAVVRTRYGAPDVLVVQDVARPTPGPGDVLVRVHTAGVSIGDHHVISGKPYLIRLTPFGGLPGPKHRVPGQAFAGRVEAVGAGVTGFQAGDDVMGDASNGAWAEHIVIPARLLASKPASLSFDEAAAVPWGVTALQGLRDAGGLQAGQKVLIVGASGAVGTWAVQIAKALGASVTAVCSARNVELVRRLGADDVIDYAHEDFASGGARFDVLLDLVGTRALSDCRRALKPGGVYVACAGGGGDWLGPIPGYVGGLLSSAFSSTRFKPLVTTPRAEDLRTLTALVEAGKARPVIERSWPLSEVVSALQHVGEGHSRGQSVLRIAG